MTLARYIQDCRRGTGLSLREVASRCKVDVAYLSRVEGNRVQPSEWMLKKLAKVFEINEDELLLLSGRLPRSIKQAVERNPRRTIPVLRSLTAMIAAEPDASYGAIEVSADTPRAIEDGFPFEAVSEVAEVESWRKEVYRPVYHLHKWWAQRLGSVFRAAILGAALPEGTAVMTLFYQPVKLPGTVVFDPFMGSGTTIGEAQKLGCTVIGRDINPVAWRSVKTALGPMSRDKLLRMFEQLEQTVGQEICGLYRSKDSKGRVCDVLYYFWVKVLPCPACGKDVDLFNSYVFAQHAYPKKFPQVQIVCPDCDSVFEGSYDQHEATCPKCSLRFRQFEGPASRITATCRTCSYEFPIAKTARERGEPPNHRLYAKLVLTDSGDKEYLPITKADLSACNAASEKLKRLGPSIPRIEIRDGYNTKQVLNYGYSRWDQMFSDRQLLALSLLSIGIHSLPACAERDALMLLFSGVLEFNNMFASYKGEGTGAVRHMFAHHILKPERMPIEAHVWGTPKSSGSFSTLFRSRLLKAIDYREAPFEVRATRQSGKLEGIKVYGASLPMGEELLSKFPADGLPPGSIYLSCGDSAHTDIPTGAVDLVITDPPFFDNVHYSELADFFHVWQRIYFNDNERGRTTTRRPEEVQDTNAISFGEKLKTVFCECYRVLRDDGLLIFSYHHSREDGWSSVAHAVLGAGFSFIQAQPVKAEMSVAMPKNQTREPIDLDILLVCRKRKHERRTLRQSRSVLQDAKNMAAGKVARFNQAGRMLSRNDALIILISQLLVELSAGRQEKDFMTALESLLSSARDVSENIYRTQTKHKVPTEEPRQATLRLVTSSQTAS